MRSTATARAGQADTWKLYKMMLRSRLLEEAVGILWQRGRISGEMHMGLGEEGVVAGVVSHLRPDDAMALDHRGTPPAVMVGIDLVELVREFLGRPDGLCSGRGGHMHLFSPQHLTASSGIVGASAPTAAGFGLAAQMLRPGSVAVAFFGEGAMNQGMVLESLNLAAVWKLPVLFVCKDNDWAITTRSSTVTAGDLVARAEALGVPTWQADGWQVEAVWEAVRQTMKRLRRGSGPAFLLARCSHLEGHFLGDPLLRVGRQPVAEVKRLAGPLARSVTAGQGAGPLQRLAGLGSMTRSIGRSIVDDRMRRRDPVERTRKHLQRLDSGRLQVLQEEVALEVGHAMEVASASQ